MVFLGKEGMTSTSANYLANLAKEILKKTESSLVNISFVDESVELINGDKKTLRHGATSLSSVKEKIEQIAQLHSFCAWVREAIKEKDKMLRELEQLSFIKYCELKGITCPEGPEKVDPVQESDIIDEMDVKERNMYLKLETYAAAYGKFIHPDGAISRAREDYLQCLEKPFSVRGEGRDLVIYGHTPSVPSQEVEEVFVKLQNQYREYEKQLNAIKFQIKDEVNKRNLEMELKHKQELNEYANAYKKIQNEMREYVINKRAEIAALKIVIPNNLQGIYSYLNSQGE